MSQYFELHPLTPQTRLIRRAADIVRAGGVIAYPTDSCYALGCHIGDKNALERVRRIRQADRHHHFTLVCRDLADIGRFAKLATWQFRLIKACTPGPYTFLLPATAETPRRLQHERRRTIGVRIPDHPVSRLLLEARLEHEIDAVLDGGNCGVIATTVIDLAVSPPVVVRVGKGPVSAISGVQRA